MDSLGRSTPVYPVGGRSYTSEVDSQFRLVADVLKKQTMELCEERDCNTKIYRQLRRLN